MIPSGCTAESVARLEAFIAAKPALSAGTQRDLLGAHEGDARCLAIRQAFEASPAGKAR